MNLRRGRLVLDVSVGILKHLRGLGMLSTCLGLALLGKGHRPHLCCSPEGREANVPTSSSAQSYFHPVKVVVNTPRKVLSPLRRG